MPIIPIVYLEPGLPLAGALLSAPCLVFYVIIYTQTDRARVATPSMQSHYHICWDGVVFTMAKNKPAHNQFEQETKYLAQITQVRWTSLPTIGLNEAGLTIQIKLCVLCTTPPTGSPAFCGREAVVYIYVHIDSTNPTDLRISDAAEDFLDKLGIKLPLVPDRERSIHPRSNTIICEFGVPDIINGYQSITRWFPVDNNVAQGLVASSIATGTMPNPIADVEFPRPLVVTRYGITLKLRPQRYHALKLLYDRAQISSAGFYNSRDLMRDAYTKAGLHIPRSVEATTEQLIHKTRIDIKALKLDIENMGAGNYALVDKDQTSGHKSIARDPRSRQKPRGNKK